jgi:CheY-like chemotaxis protein
VAQGTGLPRVLIVEDETMVRMMAASWLEELGFAVEEAGSAREALDKVRGAELVAAIIDIGLPDKKGDALAAEIRAMRAEIPIVIASGYDDKMIKTTFSGDPRVGFLGKPYLFDQLQEALRSLRVEKA